MSKEIRVVLAALLLVAGVFIVLPSGYVSAGGLVTNPGFEQGEDGVPDGWSITGDARRVDTGPVFAGNWSAQITGQGDMLTQWVGNITALRTYEIWGWVYVSGNVTGVVAIDFWAGQDGSQLSSTKMLSATDTGNTYVQRASTVFTPPETTHARIRLLGTGWNEGAEARFDGIGFWPPDDISWVDELFGDLCFIATAAYGTPMAEEIQVLRDFRDAYLVTHPAGKAFVDLYYNVSPPMATFINERPGLKPVVRAGLSPVVAMSTLAVNSTAAQRATLAGLVVLASVAGLAWAIWWGRKTEHHRGETAR